MTVRMFTTLIPKAKPLVSSLKRETAKLAKPLPEMDTFIKTSADKVVNLLPKPDYKYLEKCLSYAFTQETNGIKKDFNFLMTLAENCLKSNNKSKARVIYEHIIDEFKFLIKTDHNISSLSDKKKIAVKAYSQLAKMYIDINNPDEAINILKKITPSLNNINENSLKADIMKKLADAYELKHDFLKSKKLNEFAKTLETQTCTKLKNKTPRQKSLSQMYYHLNSAKELISKADYLRSTGKNKESDVLLYKALKLEKQAKNEFWNNIHIPFIRDKVIKGDIKARDYFNKISEEVASVRKECWQKLRKIDDISQPAIEQINKFNSMKTNGFGVLNEKLEDGFRFYSESVEVEDKGNLALRNLFSTIGEIILVDKKKDKKLQIVIENFKNHLASLEKTKGSLSQKDKMKELMKYIDKIFVPENKAHLDKMTSRLPKTEFLK